MLIMSQSRDSLFNVDNLPGIFLTSGYGDFHAGDPVKIVGAFPAEDGAVVLGTYESEERAKEILEEIVTKYGEYLKCDGELNPISCTTTPPFAFSPPKVYRMPEK